MMACLIHKEYMSHKERKLQHGQPLDAYAHSEYITHSRTHSRKHTHCKTGEDGLVDDHSYSVYFAWMRVF